MPAMQIRTVIAVLVVLAVSSSQGRAETEPTFRGYGIGGSSCATWLSSPTQFNDGISWLYGDWSVENEVNLKNHNVGHTTNGIGVVGEVKSECEEHPSELLNVAIFAVYLRLQQQDR